MYSVELREILLAKFGRRFMEKTRLATIGAALVDAIDEVRRDGEDFRSRHGIEPNKVIVCVGNNASPNNRHPEIMRALGALDSSYRDRMVVVLPMTYGAEPSYLSMVRQEIEKSSLEARVLTEPLSDKDVASLRCCTDIMVFVPTTDTFSAAMAETLYSGGILLTGAGCLTAS